MLVQQSGVFEQVVLALAVAALTFLLFTKQLDNCLEWRWQRTQSVGVASDTALEYFQKCRCSQPGRWKLIQFVSTESSYFPQTLTLIFAVFLFKTMCVYDRLLPL